MIAGGSGFLGRELCTFLEGQGFDCIVLSRSEKTEARGERWLRWDGRTVGPWAQVLDGAFALVNLAGRSINCVHTPQNRGEILRSRLESVQVLQQALASVTTLPRVWVQASSVGYYGPRAEEICDEHSAAGSGFLAEVCQEWEKAFFAKTFGGMRMVAFRIGMVLGKGGGALSVLAPLARCFLGGTAGAGTQWVSWIHSLDFLKAVLFALESEKLQGVYSLCAPNPSTNREMMRSLRHVLGRPWCPPAPAWCVRVLARYLLKTDADLVLTGQGCRPTRLLDEARFKFTFLEIEEAFRDLLSEHVCSSGKKAIF